VKPYTSAVQVFSLYKGANTAYYADDRTVFLYWYGSTERDFAIRAAMMSRPCVIWLITSDNRNRGPISPMAGRSGLVYRLHWERSGSIHTVHRPRGSQMRCFGSIDPLDGPDVWRM